MSWRDVYDLVTDSSNSILKRMDDGFSAVEKVTSSHEARLAQLEAINTVETAAIEARRVLNEEAMAERLARTRRTDRFLGGGRGLVLMVVAVAGVTLEILGRLRLF